MIRLFAPMLLLTLGGCALTGQTSPEPIIETVTTEVPVYTSCVPSEVKGPPLYPDTDRALLDADDAAERYRLLVLGRSARNERLTDLEIVVQNCRVSE
jgi:hypothetical protein